MDIWNLPNGESFSTYNTNLIKEKDKFIKTSNLYILFCNSGQAKIHIDIKEHTIIPNTLVILLRDTIINITEVSDDFDCWCVSIDSNIIMEITTRFNISFFIFLKENPCYLMNDNEKVGVGLFYKSIDYIKNDFGNMFRHQIAKNFIHNFLLDVYDKTNRKFLENKKSIGRQQELFRNFIFLVINHSKTERRVTFYADKLNISPRHLSSIIQNVIKTTPKEVIDMHAILEIKVLLKSTNMSIQEISNEMAFPDQSFFGRFFKKYTGMSPVKYRNK